MATATRWLKTGWIGATHSKKLVEILDLPADEFSVTIPMVITLLRETMKIRGISQRDLAKQLSVSEAAVSKWMATGVIGKSNIPRVSTILGIDPKLLLMEVQDGLRDIGDTNNMDLEDSVVTTQDFDISLLFQYRDQMQQYAMIPRLNVQAHCGNGIEPEAVKKDNDLAFRKDWLAKKGLNYDTLEIYEVVGASMEPYLRDGDIVLIDTEDKTDIRNGEAYVIWTKVPQGIRIKRLFTTETGDIVIRSDNTDKAVFPDERVPGRIGDTIGILGRVVWRGG